MRLFDGENLEFSAAKRAAELASAEETLLIPCVFLNDLDSVKLRPIVLGADIWRGLERAIE
jgi:hypothetical protein